MNTIQKRLIQTNYHRSRQSKLRNKPFGNIFQSTPALLQVSRNNLKSQQAEAFHLLYGWKVSVKYLNRLFYDELPLHFTVHSKNISDIHATG